MELKTYFAQDEFGNSLPDATCYLYMRGTESLISGLQRANGAQLLNPFSAESDGRIRFAAPNGIYDLRVTTANRDYRFSIQCNDVAEDVASAQTSAERAEAAQDAAVLSAGVKDNIAHGLATTENGLNFTVLSSAPYEYVSLYKNNAGTAVLLDSYPNTKAVDRLSVALDDGTLPGMAWSVGDEHGAHPLRLRDDGVTEADEIQTEAIQTEVLTLQQGMELRAKGILGVSLALLDLLGNCPFLIKDDGTSAFASVETTTLTIAGVDVWEKMKTLNAAKRTDTVMGAAGLVPLYADMTKISGWGSSSLNFLAPQMASMFATVAPGATYYNGAQGGETARGIAGRLGSIPMLISVPGGSLAASGVTTVSCSNVAPNSMMRSFTGTLAGVYGTLSSDGASFTFARAAAGSAVGVASNTPFLPDVGPQYRTGVALLWMGKNDIGSSDTSTEIAGRTDASFDYFTPYVKRMLVLGHFGNPDWVGGATLVPKMLQINALHAARYGANYIDVLSYLESPAVWTDTGINPTATDLAAQAGHCLPPSLTDDGIHFNAKLNVAFTAFLKTKLIALGWF